jgi:hypothetical protein
MSEIIWQHNDPTSWYHDTSCSCDHHCRYCFSDLTKGYDPRARYCSAHCRSQMKKERALDRALSERG